MSDRVERHEEIRPLPRLLLVDDEQPLLRLYRRVLAEQYDLSFCSQGEEAVKAVDQALAANLPYAAAFIDVQMPPGRDGIWTAEQIRQRDPHVEIVIVTAYADISPAEIAQRLPPAHKLLFLQKPFNVPEINQFAAALTAKWDTERTAYRLYRGQEELVRQRTRDLEASNAALQKALVELRRTFGGIVQVLTATVETRDPYTAGHQARVADLARTIAAAMGLAPELVEGIRVAGIVHDLGKIAIPAEILSKPGRLTDMEFGLIKSHSRVGYDLLQHIDFPWPVADIVHQHHEKVDGSGYPQGLTGGQLLLESRILTVADVVEAMASHRPYRPALGVDKALEEIDRHRGSQYDEVAVKACIDVFRRKGYTFAS